MLRSLGVIALRMMFRGGAMGLGGALVFFGGFRVSFIRHEKSPLFQAPVNVATTS
jgi:hypothetical protein